MNREYVDVDLHRRRSVIVVLDSPATVTGCLVPASPTTKWRSLKCLPEPAEVWCRSSRLEATFFWYWAVDLTPLRAGYQVHLSHPPGNDWGNRQVKNDARYVHHLADLLRLGWGWPRRGSPHRRSARSASWSATGLRWCSCNQGSRPRVTR